jgi:hypothetical protein
VIDKVLIRTFLDKVKKPMLLSSFEKKLAMNWRFLINYYAFVLRLFEIIDKDDQVLEILPLCIKGLKSNHCPLPVKSFIAEAMANTFG